MNLSGISPSLQPSFSMPSQGAGDADTKLKALERQLQQLNQEKQKAVQNKDEEAKKKIEKEIEKIEREIQKLKQHKKETPEETSPQADPTENPVFQSPDLGNQVDVYG